MSTRTNPLRASLRFLIALLVAALSACGTSPTGRDQLLVFSADDLDAMGVQAFEEMRKQLPEETDPAINAYVRCVAEAITDKVSETRYSWEVLVFKDENPNAFALPGGKMGVYLYS